MFKKRKGKKTNLKSNTHHGGAAGNDAISGGDGKGEGDFESGPESEDDSEHVLQHQLMRKKKIRQKEFRKERTANSYIDEDQDDHNQRQQEVAEKHRKKKKKETKHKIDIDVGAQSPKDATSIDTVGFVPNIEALEIEPTKKDAVENQTQSRTYNKDSLAQMRKETQFIPQPSSLSSTHKETEINRLIARDEFRDHDDDGTDFGKEQSEKVKRLIHGGGEESKSRESGKWFRFERDQNNVEEMYESFQSEKAVNSGSLTKTVPMEIEEASDEEEMRRWEDSKIREAANGTVIPQSVSHGADSTFQTTIISTPEDVLSSLAKRLSIMENSHEQNERELTRLKVEQNAWDEEKNELDDEIAVCSTTFENMQRFHVYILGLCNCLTSKTEKINHVEASIRSMEKRTVHDARQERLQAFADVIHKGEEIRDKFIVISRGDRGLFPMSDFWPMQREDEARVDELGRDLNYLKEKELDIRIGALENRLSIHTKKELGNLQVNAVEIDFKTYRERRGNMIKALNMIFEDVDGDFASAAAIIKNLNEWKSKYKSEYNQAFVTDSLPELLAPFMQIDFLKWDVLDPEIKNKISDLAWFDDVDEPQVKMKLLEKFCIPSFHYMLTAVYEPLNVSQTKDILELLEWIVAKAQVMNVDVFGQKGYLSKNGILDALVKKLKNSEAETCLPLIEYGYYTLCDSITSRQLEYSLLLMQTLEMVVCSLNSLREKYDIDTVIGGCFEDVIDTTRKLAEKQVRLISHMVVKRQKYKEENRVVDEYYFNHGIEILKKILEHFTVIIELINSPGSQWFKTLRKQMNELL